MIKKKLIKLENIEIEKKYRNRNIEKENDKKIENNIYGHDFIIM